ncbi:MAG: MBL fold metallo-hydrolase [Chloroflexi bacterium]|nr:MBL fold metallo-hydrolase [Chloroflexota bacterium]
MRLDRVAEDIFIVISEMYAQVTAAVIFTNQGAIVIDTLPYPAETRQMLSFIEDKLGADAVRYVVNTHCHADHVYGSYLFESATVISHDLCREILLRSGERLLARAQRENTNLAEVRLRPPQVTFANEMHLHLGPRHVRLIHTPGHTSDSIIAFTVDDRVVIAGDTMMPIPHISGGDITSLVASLRSIQELNPNFIVQGHGDVLLRGEVDEAIETNICYLVTITERVRELVERKQSLASLLSVDIEACGISRIPLDGLVGRIHQTNLNSLYQRFTTEESAD